MFNILKRNQEIIMYLVFGVLTTVVNIILYYIFNDIIPMNFTTHQYLIASLIAWIGAVIFAFYTNKYIVFKSNKKEDTVKELTSFILFRLLSLVFDLAIMFVMVDLLIVDDLLSKIIANVVVIVLNYVFSKLFIFKK